jgi:glycosyltransferase involved in cell wall biosynthesis
VTTLAAIVPVFNQRAELPVTLDALDAAIVASPFDAEIVVVDDGSTDGTADAARAWRGRTPLTVIEQSNAGRFLARRHGIEAVTSEYCLLVDSRVRIGERALRFVADEIAADNCKQLWTADVLIVTGGNPFGTFWDVLTRRAFSAYFDDRRTASFGLEEFDRFPKGTTCFFAPRDLLLAAFDAFETPYRDLRHANDDTPLIRWLAARRPINISPRYSCTYEPRQRFVPFLRHAFHRGTVFVDGHGRRESRLFPATIAFFPLSAGWLVTSKFVPVVLGLPVAASSIAGVGLAVADRRPRLAATMAWVTPLYALAHGAGMWRGLALALTGRVAR